MSKLITSLSSVLFVAVLSISCGTEPEGGVEYVPAFLEQIDSIRITSRNATVYGIGSSECSNDVFGNFKLAYMSGRINVSLNSKRTDNVCLTAFAHYDVVIDIPVDKGGTYAIRLPYGYREYFDTTVVIPD